MKRKEALLKMKEMIDDNKSEMEIADFDFPVYLSVYRGLERYRLLKSKPRDHEVNVVVIQGPTGTGKSRYAMDKFPNAYWKQRSNWWDGYANHETVVIDEFYGWLPYDLLLRICDRYPLMVETKGGQVNFVASTVVFTTNSLPERWYKNVYFKSFIRRVSKWMILPVWGEMSEYEDYTNALKDMIDNEI